MTLLDDCADFHAWMFIRYRLLVHPFCTQSRTFLLPPGLESPRQAKKARSAASTPDLSTTAEMSTSPHQLVRPYHTPEEQKHKYFNMRADRAEALLNLVRRRQKDDIEQPTRNKVMAVLKRKLINQLRVPTRANASFHLYREVDLVTCQAAKSVFFDLKRTGPFLRGNSSYYNFETDDHAVMRQWFSLQLPRTNGIGHAMMRSHGQVLVMARPPFLIEHQSNEEEAEGLKLTAGIMTLNCRGTPRYAPPPPPEEDSAALRLERKAAADRDLEVAWSLVMELAEKGSCKLDPHWYLTLGQKFGRTWLSYLSDQEGMDSEPGEAENSEEED